MTAEEIARICHEANRAYCRALGDYSQESWNLAPIWQRESAIEGVRAALADRARTPEASHRGWMDHKLAEGWRYGPIKDAQAKTHPCLISYDALPEEQRRKDELFLAIVRALE